jgi:DNA-binding transcriptional regulator YiaG
MIPAVMTNRYGQWLKSARLDTIDDTTGRPLTQARLAELMDISVSKVAAWERGDITSISRKTPTRLHVS